MGPLPELETPDRNALPGIVFTKPAPRRTTRRSPSPPDVRLVTTVRRRHRDGARYAAAHRRCRQDGAMEVDATEVATTTCCPPRHDGSAKTTTGSTPRRRPPLRSPGRCPGGQCHGGRPHSSPLDEDDATPELVFTKPALGTLTPPRSVSWRSTPRWPPPLITARRGRRVAGARLHQARAMDADATEVDASEVDATVAALHS